ncbi:acetyltransferase [Sulfodiicoccus acidiphilus]|uniref:Acetyltransferase n=1 Tax=Sulfodiicoccus acidiphilus TaxID=1670455 RepID=A0A348B2X6_9CREN|nr:gamma carbonic anhydrase family protein [Sulfodiicoccus acidiphilus]BBD72528.1 acetyltransferase [Sulfodiicoccus acidiphilus]GGT93892.1 acetyltransferase [Sulfodiicoccus acidiphilus]
MPLEPFLGKMPRVRDAYVHPTAYLVGDVEVDERSSVWHHAVLRGDNDSIYMGRESNVQESSTVHTDRGFRVYIGDRVSIGHNAVIHGAHVSSNVIVGMGAILLNGSKVGEYSIIGAGALIPEGKEVPAYSVALGVPAKVVRKVNEKDVKAIEENALDYVRLIERMKNE